jgi:hypothetical protein
MCLRSHRHAGDVDPGDERLVAGGMKLRGGVLVGAAGENVGDLIVGLYRPRFLGHLIEPYAALATD